MADSMVFGLFELLIADETLLSSGIPVKLGFRAIGVLTMLAGSGNRVVTSDEIMTKIWPERVVERSNLTIQIAKLRALLGKDSILADAHGGYRFTLSTKIVKSIH